MTKSRERIRHYQTVLQEGKMARLKKATGEHSVKEALYKAVDYYLDQHPEAVV